MPELDVSRVAELNRAISSLEGVRDLLVTERANQMVTVLESLPPESCLDRIIRRSPNGYVEVLTGIRLNRFCIDPCPNTHLPLIQLAYVPVHGVVGISLHGDEIKLVATSVGQDAIHRVLRTIDTDRLATFLAPLSVAAQLG